MIAAASHHRNSLGYTIGATQRGQAMIVFGRNNHGNLVSIDEVERGAVQELRCECGVLLVAKKGDVREHHFAHKAGADRSCAIATRAALMRFITNTLLDQREISLPLTEGRIGSAQVLALEELPEEQLPTLKIDAPKGRQLIVVFKVKRRKLDRAPYREQGISAIEVDLTNDRNGTDDQVRAAILRHAPRLWLFYRPKPEAEMSSRPGRPNPITAEEMARLRRILS